MSARHNVSFSMEIFFRFTKKLKASKITLSCNRPISVNDNYTLEGFANSTVAEKGTESRLIDLQLHAMQRKDKFVKSDKLILENLK